ncbi:MAG: endo-1,4-beta-xylanase [Ignavibacteriaceae bacterium]
MSKTKSLKDSSIAGISAEILTPKRTKTLTEKGELIFKPFFVQRGNGPNLLDWSYACDENWDAFYSNISVDKDGVKVSDANGKEKFSIEVRWNVEDFGYIFIFADNGGEYYSLPPSGEEKTLNLNFELAKSRIFRNRKRIENHKKDGWLPSYELNAFINLSEELFNDAKKLENLSEQCGEVSQKSLLYAMRTSEMIELQKAEYDIQKNKVRKDFFIGCDARGFSQMDPDLFMELFSNQFNYATITYYLISESYRDFEPVEDKLQFDTRDVVYNELKKKNITVEGRPLYWPYKTVTPDWLRRKSYDEVLKYVEKHVREVVSHYGDGMYAWEVVNESHDWANEMQLTPEQTTNITKLACEVAKDTNPKVHRLINNCCPFAEYVQLKKWGELDAKYPQRTPLQFMQDLVDNDVDFTITGQQMYFPFRDLSDTIILIERHKKFGRPVQLTEVGATSGPNKTSITNGTLEIKNEPYVWHRNWDQELQADWLEGLYTLAYSRQWIEAVNWYDFVDPYSWIKNGGLLESPKGEKKSSYERLLTLQKKWGLKS